MKEEANRMVKKGTERKRLRKKRENSEKGASGGQENAELLSKR